MVRMEIIANSAVQDDIIEALLAVGENDYYTVIPGIQGRGRSVPKQGDHIWPEENFIMILYGDKKRQKKIEKEKKMNIETPEREQPLSKLLVPDTIIVNEESTNRCHRYFITFNIINVYCLI